MQFNFDKKRSLPNHVWWVLRLSFSELPLLVTAMLLGYTITRLTQLVNAFVLGLLIDWALEAQSSGDPNFSYPLIIFAGYFLLITTGKTLNMLGRGASSFQISYKIPMEMLQEKLHRLSIATLEKPKVQDAVNRYNENTNSISEVFVTSLIIIGSLVSLITSMLPVLVFMPLLTLLIILSAIPDIFFSRKFTKKLWDLEKETTIDRRKGYHAHNSLVTPEFLKEVELTDIFKYLKRYFLTYTDKVFVGELKIFKQWSVMEYVSSFTYILILGIAIYNILNLAIVGEISIGQISFYVTAVLSISSSLTSIASETSYLGGEADRLDEIRTVLELPERQTMAQELRLQGSVPKISVRNVSYSYPNTEENVLQDVNLEIDPGEKIAIVGENGAGKTTLIKLISNVYNPTAGSIKVDGHNLHEIDERDWFPKLGVLYQTFNEYENLTALENIAIGDLESTGVEYSQLTVSEAIQKLYNNPETYSRVVAAAKRANAHEFISKYENGYLTILSEKYENGVRPSKGQWQKIAIARFLFRDAPVLILDEPTAAIDAVAEAEIFDNLYQHMQNRTVIIVSHRFSTVRNADRIIVVDEGKIVEQGSHEELMQNEGLYKKMFNIQAKGYK